MPAEMRPIRSVGSMKLSRVVAIPPIRIPKCNHYKRQFPNVSFDIAHVAETHQVLTLRKVRSFAKMTCRYGTGPPNVNILTLTSPLQRPCTHLGFDPDRNGYPLVRRRMYTRILDPVSFRQGTSLVVALALFRKRRLSVVLVRLLGLEQLLQASRVEERVFLVIRPTGLQRIDIETQAVVPLTGSRVPPYGLGSSASGGQLFELNVDRILWSVKARPHSCARSATHIVFSLLSGLLSLPDELGRQVQTLDLVVTRVHQVFIVLAFTVGLFVSLGRARDRVGPRRRTDVGAVGSLDGDLFGSLGIGGSTNVPVHLRLLPGRSKVRTCVCGANDTTRLTQKGISSTRSGSKVAHP
jgi:hypothetical protein